MSFIQRYVYASRPLKSPCVRFLSTHSNHQDAPSFNSLSQDGSSDDVTFIDSNHRRLKLRIPIFDLPPRAPPDISTSPETFTDDDAPRNHPDGIPLTDEFGVPIAKSSSAPPVRTRPPRRKYVPPGAYSSLYETDDHDPTEGRFPNSLESSVFHPAFFLAAQDRTLPATWGEFSNRMTRATQVELQKWTRKLDEGSLGGENLKSGKVLEEIQDELEELHDSVQGKPSLSPKSVFFPKRLSVTSMITQYCEIRGFYDMLYQLNKRSSSESNSLLGSDNGRVSEEVKQKRLAMLFKNLVGYSVSSVEADQVDPLLPISGIEDVTRQGSDLLSKFQAYAASKDISRRQLVALNRGTEIHNMLETIADQEAGISFSVITEVTSIEEEWAIKLLKMAVKLHALLRTGKIRELYVFGEYDGSLMTGIIDDVALEDFSKGRGRKSQGGALSEEERLLKHGRVVITDTKTRMSATLPQWSQQYSAYHQVLIYHRLFKDLSEGSFDFELLYRSSGLDPDKPIPWETISSFSSSNMMGGIQGIGDIEGREMNVTLRDVEKLLKEALGLFQGRVSDKVQVQYLYKKRKSARLVGQPEAITTATLTPDPSSSTTEGNGDGQLGTVGTRNETPLAEAAAAPLAVAAASETPQVIATIQYLVDTSRTEQMLQFGSRYWLGLRAPIGVAPDEVSFKCQNCLWARVCGWRKSVEKTFA